jgi:hypothetical protein
MQILGAGLKLAGAVGAALGNAGKETVAPANPVAHVVATITVNVPTTTYVRNDLVSDVDVPVGVHNMADATNLNTNTNSTGSSNGNGGTRGAATGPVAPVAAAAAEPQASQAQLDSANAKITALTDELKALKTAFDELCKLINENNSKLIADYRRLDQATRDDVTSGRLEAHVARQLVAGDGHMFRYIFTPTGKHTNTQVFGVSKGPLSTNVTVHMHRCGDGSATGAPGSGMPTQAHPPPTPK